MLRQRAIQAARVFQAETSEADDEDVYDSIDLEPFDDHLFRTANLELTNLNVSDVTLPAYAICRTPNSLETKCT